MGYGATFLAHTGILRGKQQDPFYQSTLFLVILRFCIFLFWWLPIKYFFPNFANVIFFCYMPFYLDLSEFDGRRRNEVLKRSFLARFMRWYFDCKLVKTVDIDQQCILGVHHHGMLPFGAVTCLGTESNNFSELFPRLVDRVIVAATTVFLVPLFRDLTLMASVTDCNKWSFERFLKKGTSVAVFPGGAHEAEFATPDVEMLDLKRKLGFLKLSLKYNVPVVPAYSFNETDHYRQLTFPESAKKYPVYHYMRIVYHNVTGKRMVDT